MSKHSLFLNNLLEFIINNLINISFKVGSVDPKLDASDEMHSKCVLIWNLFFFLKMFIHVFVFAFKMRVAGMLFSLIYFNEKSCMF